MVKLESYSSNNKRTAHKRDLQAVIDGLIISDKILNKVSQLIRQGFSEVTNFAFPLIERK